MIVDIYNEVLTKLKAELTDVEISQSNPIGVPNAPCVVFKELSNNSDPEHRDSAGEKYNALAFEINIYTIGATRISQSRAIRLLADGVMADYYNMNRDFSDEVQNYADTTVYRYILRYSCLVDENKKVYIRR